MTEALTLNALETAINRARAAEPARGPEASLGRDVAVLAGLYGRMIWARVESLTLDEISAAERAVLTRWGT
jgi:hypothetical protein